MSELLVGTGAAAGAGALWWLWRGARAHRIARERLHEDVVVNEPSAYVVELQPTLRRYRFLPWAVGALVLAIFRFGLDFGLVYATALAVIAGVTVWILEQQLAAHRALKIESQLATAIDLMVASLGAGSSIMEAIENAARESREPLRSELLELMGRIRYGESAQVVFEDFGRRIPLENVRLFSFTMAVHAEVGGSLAPTLATVGRSIRDRIEISRRIRSQSTQAQASVIGIVCITYFLGLMMWRTNPAHFEEYLRHPVGANFVGGAMVLQAIGVLWITKLAQLRF
jgi:Flp pilus assembly protein TadB